MEDSKKIIPLLAKRKAVEQTTPFLKYYQGGYRRLVAIGNGQLSAIRYDPDVELPETNLYYPLNVVRKGFSGVKAKKTDIVALRAHAGDVDPKEDRKAEPDKDIFRRYNMLPLLHTKDTNMLRQQAYLLQEIIHPIMQGQRGLIPSLLIFSGRGFQLIWYADKIYPVDEEYTIEMWEKLGRAIIATVGGDAVHNVDRILRLPGTTNTKTGMVSRIVFETNNTYTPAAIYAAYGEPPVRTDAIDQGVDPTEFKYVDWDVVFAVADPLDLKDDVLKRFERDRKKDTEIANLYDGVPLPQQGDRSGSGFDLMLVGRLKRAGYEPQEAFEIIMSYDFGSGHKKARHNDRRYFMRCWSRSPGERRTTPQEDFADIVPVPVVETVSTQRNSTKAFKDIRDNYLYVATVNRVIHIHSGRYFDRTGFDEKFITTNPGGRDNAPLAHRALIAAGRQVDGVTWEPGRERRFQKDRLFYYNMYRPNAKPVCNYTKGCTKPYHDVLAWVIPKKIQQETLLDHMAFTVQHPERKINWHPLMYSIEEGVGKDTVLAIIKHAVGEHNASETKLEDMTGNFNSVLRYKKVIIINEVMSFERGKEISNTLKPLLASPPTTIEINTKYEPQFSQPNLLSVYMTSNSTRPLHLGKVDRRTLPIRCREEKMPIDMADKIWDWFDNGGLELMYYELLHRDISQFNPNARPANDELMMDHLNMQQLSKSHSEVLIEELIDNEDDVFERDIVLRNKLIEFAYQRHMPITTVEEALRNAGAVQLNRCSVSFGKHPSRKGNIVRKYTMWVVRNKSDYLLGEGPHAAEKKDSISYRDLYKTATGLSDFEDAMEEEEIL